MEFLFKISGHDFFQVAATYMLSRDYTNVTSFEMLKQKSFEIREKFEYILRFIYSCEERMALAQDAYIRYVEILHSQLKDSSYAEEGYKVLENDVILAQAAVESFELQRANEARVEYNNNTAKAYA